MYRISIATVLTALAFAAFPIGSAATIPYDGAVTTGMRMENALEIAKRCVIAAAAFDGESHVDKQKQRELEATARGVKPIENPERDKKEKLREVRPDDKLVFVGITDKSRLMALRRYIIRNTRIGVQSIWGSPIGDGEARPYFLGPNALLDIETGWTIEKLAEEISSAAALPYITHATAGKLVANCWWRSVRINEKEIPPKDGFAEGEMINGSTRGTTIRIPDAAKMAGCLNSDKKMVLPDVSLTDGGRTEYEYSTVDLADEMKRIIGSGTYGNLITYISENARPTFDFEDTAKILVVNALVRAYKASHGGAKCNAFSFRPATACSNDLSIHNKQTLEKFGLTVKAFEDGFAPRTPIRTGTPKGASRNPSFTRSTQLISGTYKPPVDDNRVGLITLNTTFQQMLKIVADDLCKQANGGKPCQG